MERVDFELGEKKYVCISDSAARAASLLTSPPRNIA